MVKKRQFLWSSLASVSLLLLTACGGSPAAPAGSQPAKPADSQPAKPADSQPAAPAAPAKVVKIGALVPLTGNDALDGQNQKRAHDLAVEEINAAGGIKALGGAKVEIVYGDTQGKPEIGNAEVERLITKDGVVAMLGAYHSGVTVSAIRIAERYKVPFLVPNALSDEITELGMKYTFKTVPRASDYARDTGALLEFLNKKHNTSAKTVGIIRPDNFIGKQIGAGWDKWLPQKGFQIVAHVAYPATSPNMQEAVLKLKAANPDVIMAQGGASEAILIIKTLKELNYWPKHGVIAAGGGWSDPNVLKNVGALGEKLFLVNDWFPLINRPGSEETNKAFRDKYGVDMTGNANTTYAGTWVLKEAIEKAGKAEAEAIREALTRIELTGGKVGFMYDKVKFAADGMNEGAFNVAAQVQDGRPVTVWPEHVKKADSIWPVPDWSKR